jgi:hypothetical protein
MQILTVRCKLDGSKTATIEAFGLPVRRPRDPRLRDQYVQVACTVLPGNPRALRALRQPGHKSHCPRHWSKPGGYRRNKANTRSRYKGCLSSSGSVGGPGTVLEHRKRRAFAARRGQPSAASRPLDDPIVSRPGGSMSSNGTLAGREIPTTNRRHAPARHAGPNGSNARDRRYERCHKAGRWHQQVRAPQTCPGRPKSPKSAYVYAIGCSEASAFAVRHDTNLSSTRMARGCDQAARYRRRSFSVNASAPIASLNLLESARKWPCHNSSSGKYGMVKKPHIAALSPLPRIVPHCLVPHCRMPGVECREPFDAISMAHGRPPPTAAPNRVG